MEAVQNLKEKKIDVSTIRGINQQTFIQKLKAYKNKPLSLCLMI